MVPVEEGGGGVTCKYVHLLGLRRDCVSVLSLLKADCLLP